MTFKFNTDETPEENLDRAMADGDIRWAPGYAEPGYDEPEKGVLLANWNKTSHYDHELKQRVDDDDSMPKLAEAAEAEGYGVEWSDEWCECSACEKTFRISPDSYGWTMAGAEVNGEMLCSECIVADPDEYLDELKGNPDRALGFELDLEEHGYTQVNDERFQSGFHPGQTASAHAIAKTLRAAGIEDFIFTIDSKGQFDVDFSVWVHTNEPGGSCEKAYQALKNGTTTFEPGKDPASMTERGLREATAVANKLEGPGVRVVKIVGDKATAKLVSPEDFIAGKALDDD